jgi:hypothetical protein
VTINEQRGAESGGSPLEVSAALEGQATRLNDRKAAQLTPMEWGEAYDEGMALAAKMFPSTSQKERDAFATGYARQKTRT